MNRTEYVNLRQSAYALVGVVGTTAELLDVTSEFDSAYCKGCGMLDAIDALGVRLGYVDAETNEVIPLSNECPF